MYTRLSNEKIEVGNSTILIENEDERESGSISTQKSFLKNFCEENKLMIYDTYVDDGVSGATFDRPDFNRMINDIENKKVNMVLTKDLSRFGRLSSKISYYLEEYFIENGVRFIAITDDIDTGHIETSEEMVQFKSFFNEWYVRDTSRKVRNGKKVRAKEGKVMTTYPTYGYKKDPENHNHYIIDEEVAPVVKNIFKMSLDGYTSTQIATMLSDKKVKVPSEVVGNTHIRKNEIKRGWNRNTINRILKNITYLGYVSNGNTKKVNYKSKKILMMPKEDRIIVKNMHEPIVDVDTFEKVQEILKSRTGVRVKNYDWLLKGMIYCRECGKKLSLVPQINNHKKTFYFRCNTYASNTHLYLCTPHSGNLEKTTNLIIAEIKEKCKNILEEDRELRLAQNKEVLNLNHEISILKKNVTDINERIEKLFEDKCKGIFDEEDFSRLYTKLKSERAESEEKISELKEKAKNQESTDEIKVVLKNFLDAKEITRIELMALVDKIEINEQKKFTIHYKYNLLNEKF